MNQALYGLLLLRLITLDDALMTSNDGVELQNMLEGNSPSGARWSERHDERRPQRPRVIGRA